MQTLSTQQIPAGPGSIAQVRVCARLLLQWSKARQTPLLLAGHVTKDGVLAGPRALEHMVDVVLYLEGDPLSSLRVLRSEKNRFGSTSEVGIFEMGEQGLQEVADPSQLLLEERQADAPGSVIVGALEGSRPMLLEVQALVTPTLFPNPRRIANGMAFNRLLMVAAVLSKRLGLPLGSQDIIANIVGGIRVEEPAADLAAALAIASSMREVAVRPSLVAVGEIGLAGELRRIPQLARRLTEASRLGFRQAMIPAGQAKEAEGIVDIEVLPARDVREAIANGLSPSGHPRSASGRRLSLAASEASQP